MQDLSGKSIKGYQLQAHLGEGAYGAVYRATQPQIKREVAIKIISRNTPTSRTSSVVLRPKRSWWRSWSTCTSCRCTTTGVSRAVPTW